MFSCPAPLFPGQQRGIGGRAEQDKQNSASRTMPASQSADFFFEEKADDEEAAGRSEMSLLYGGIA
jgi:hypothetical protein